MSQEVSKRLVGCNPSLPYLQVGYNTLILTIDPNLLGHPSATPRMPVAIKGISRPPLFKHAVILVVTVTGRAVDVWGVISKTKLDILNLCDLRPRCWCKETGS